MTYLQQTYWQGTDVWVWLFTQGTGDLNDEVKNRTAHINLNCTEICSSSALCPLGNFMAAEQGGWTKKLYVDF